MHSPQPSQPHSNSRVHSALLRFVLLAIAIVLLSQSAYAQTIVAQWTFEDADGVFTRDPAIDITGNATAFPPAAGGHVVGNPGLAWTLTNWPTVNAAADNAHFGFQLDLSSYSHIMLTFDARRSGTGPDTFVIQYSIDGINYTSIDSTVRNVPTTNWESYTLDFGSGTAVDQAIAGKSAVYFRIHAYNAGGATGTWRIDNVTFTANASFTATSELSFVSANAAQGDVTATVNGVDATSPENVEENAAVVLTAMPETGFIFVDWSGTGGICEGTDAQLSFTMPATDVSCTANFTAETVTETFELSFVSANDAQGNIAATVDGANVTSPENVEENANVVLTANPETGFVFASWSGTAGICEGTDAQLSFAMPASAVSCTATFQTQTLPPSVGGFAEPLFPAGE